MVRLKIIGFILVAGSLLLIGCGGGKKITDQVAFVSDRDGNYDIYIMNTDGSSQRNLTHNTANDNSPTWSPDGTLIAFVSNREGNPTIYMMDADGSNVRLITEGYQPAWSPDGKEIAYVLDVNGNPDLYQVNIAKQTSQVLLSSPAVEYNPTWSPDGKQIAFEKITQGNSDIYVLDLKTNSVRNLTNSPGNEQKPVWSPDGRQIVACDSNQIVVMDANGSNSRRLTSSGANFDPAWKPRTAK
jgi:Tol biopolymer transport system component